VRRKFPQMAHDVMKMIDPELVVQDPKGHREKQQAEQGRKAMQELLFHRAA